MAKKWNAKELITDIQKKTLEASQIALQDGLAIMQQQLTAGKDYNGANPKPYNPNYSKLRSKQRATTSKKGNLIASTSKVDWLLKGTLRRSFKVLPVLQKGKTGARLTAIGSNSGISNLELLKYQIGLRPTMWGFSQKSWDAIIKAFKNKLKF